MADFDYSPSEFVPFRDKKVIERVRKIKRADIEKHPNPDFKIRVVRDDEVKLIWVADMFHPDESGVSYMHRWPMKDNVT